MPPTPAFRRQWLTSWSNTALGCITWFNRGGRSPASLSPCPTRAWSLPQRALLSSGAALRPARQRLRFAALCVVPSLTTCRFAHHDDHCMHRRRRQLRTLRIQPDSLLWGGSGGRLPLGRKLGSGDAPLSAPPRPASAPRRLLEPLWAAGTRVPRRSACAGGPASEANSHSPPPRLRLAGALTGFDRGAGRRRGGLAARDGCPIAQSRSSLPATLSVSSSRPFPRAPPPGEAS